MRKFYFYVILPLLVSSSVFGQASDREKRTTASNVRTTINNLGLVGNGFRGSFNVLGWSSFEYPAGSGKEHLFQGGLWIGAYINGAQVAVSTGAIDDASGYEPGKSGFEFTSEPNAPFIERSSLVNSQLYNPKAVSHQDFVSDFTDRNVVVPGTRTLIAGHDNPLGVDIHFESYNWNLNFADYFVILNYKITNKGANTLDSLYLGFWENGVVRNTNITPAGQGGTQFYNKGGNGYIDSLYLAYDFDAAGDLGFTESYFGVKFLGAEDSKGKFYHPAINDRFKPHFHSWQFRNSSEPLFFSPTTDNQRYQKMSNGLNHRADWSTIQKSLSQANNRANLLSVGPYVSLKPGESITIAFAVMAQPKFEDGKPNTDNNAVQQRNLVRGAQAIQAAYNGEDVNFNGILDEGEDTDGDGKITRFILPSPPDVPHTKFIAKDNAIEIYWADNAERSIDPISKTEDFEGYRLYMTRVGFDVQQTIDVQNSLKLIASYDVPGNKLFFDNGFNAIRLPEAVRFEGDPVNYVYKYTIKNIQNGWQHIIALTAFDKGDPENNMESLETSKLINMKRMFPGTPANEDPKKNSPYVYPNPYYAGASWEGRSGFSEDKKLIFANLPERCVIRVFNTSGDLIKTIQHDQNYIGSDARWFRLYSNTDETVFSGGEHAWDLLSTDTQIIAPGLYIFSVEDAKTGKAYTGKFTVIK